MQVGTKETKLDKKKQKLSYIITTPGLSLQMNVLYEESLPISMAKYMDLQHLNKSFSIKYNSSMTITDLMMMVLVIMTMVIKLLGKLSFI